MKLLKPTWVNHNGKPIFSVDIHPDGTKFATGGQGQDSGKVVIWNMSPVLQEDDEKDENIPKMLCQMDNHLEILATLRGHSGLVKGLTWDPVGKYIASQADDRSLKVWRTLDWQLETSITKPFDECGGTTHVLRLSWSPDGHYLVSAHAMNNSGPTAQIIEREGWKTNMDFVGHRKAVTVVKFNPKIFKKKQKNGSSAKPSCPYCCCAVGSKDRSLSVWLTCLKRPLVVIHELFDKSIMDISWTLNGLGILVCSMDGSVAFLDFSQDELGDPLSEEEKSRIHQSTYGKSLAIMTEAQLSTAVIENPEMLKYQRRQQQLDQKSAVAREMGSATSVAVNGESLEDIRKNLLKKQVETRTADGRRRITPLCIAQLDTGDFSTAFFNSIPLSGSLAGTVLSSHSSPQLLPLDSCTPNSFGASKPSTEHMVAVGAKPVGESVSKDSVTATSASAASSPSVLTTPSKIEPMKAFDSRFTERSKATSGAPAMTSVTPTAVERLKEQNLVKEIRPRDLLESSSDSDEKVPVAKPSSLSKRKLELEAETVEKKKKGRPRKDSRLMPVSLSVQSPASLTAEKDALCLSAPALALKLPIPGPQRAFTLQVSSDPSMYIEVENEVTAVGGVKLSRLKCNREGKEWETVLTSRILTAAGSCDIVCVACEKRMLSVFSICGRRLLPPILLPSPISTLHCTGSYVMALTAAATLSVWDVHKQVVVVKEESLHSILAGSDMTVSQILLTQHGIPVMNLSDGKAYCFNPSLSTWNLVSDKQDSLAQCADFRSSLPSQDAMLCSGPLAIIQGRTSNSGRQAARLFSMPHVVQQETTLAYLENQVAAALSLQSSHEYRHWLLIYARYLVNEGSAEEGAAEGATASHRAEPPLPATLHRVSGTARYPEGQVACPGLPQLQQRQCHAVATDHTQGRHSPGQATVGGGGTGRKCGILQLCWPSILGAPPLCPGPHVPSQGCSSTCNSALLPGPPCRAGARTLPCCLVASVALPSLPTPARPRGVH
ncbi:protein HIRA isoform 4-T4 [Dugong dugon]